MKFKIYIPSKGRAKNQITANLLNKYGIPFTIVVDPKELDEYRTACYPYNVIAVDEDDLGLPAARSWIKRRSIFLGEPYHWQLEDDISQFLYRDELVCKKLPPDDVLYRIEEKVTRYSNVAIASPDHNSWPPGPDPMKINRIAHHAVLVNNSIPVMWRPFFFEDADFSLQCLAAGYTTILFSHLRFNSVAPMKQEGGQTPRYLQGWKEHMKTLAAAWPPVSVVDRPGGKFQLRYNRIWSTFKQTPVLK